MPPVQPERPINVDLDRGMWADEIMWEKPAADAPRPRFQELLLDMNDPEMMIERDDAGTRGELAWSALPRTAYSRPVRRERIAADPS